MRASTRGRTRPSRSPPRPRARRSPAVRPSAERRRVQGRCFPSWAWLDAVRGAVERHGARAVFAARGVLGCRVATSRAAGTFQVPAFRFALAEAAGSAIFVPAMATLGFLCSDRAELVARDVGRVQHWLVLLGLLALALYLGLRAWIGRTGLGGEGPVTGDPPRGGRDARE